MTFRVVINPSFVSVEFEAGSLKEAVAIIQNEAESLPVLQSFAGMQGGPVMLETEMTGAPSNAVTAPPAPPAAGGKPKRGRPSAADKAAAEKAAAAAAAAAPAPLPVPGAAPPPAPAPLPVPGAAPPPPAPAPLPAPADAVPPHALPPAPPAPGHGMPDSLVRVQAAPGINPPAFVSPPPPAPPVSPLSDKIVEKLRTLKDGGVDVVSWLSAPPPSGCGMVAPGFSFDEAMDVIRITEEARLASLATALGVQ